MWALTSLNYYSFARPEYMKHKITRAHEKGIFYIVFSQYQELVPICTERWCTEANEATQTHCYDPVAPAYPIWAYYASMQLFYGVVVYFLIASRNFYNLRITQAYIIRSITRFYT